MRKRKSSRVLIVLPTLGERIDFLKLTLDSIEDQHEVGVDVVIICPKKSKSAVMLAKRYGAKVIDDPGGLSAAVNVGILSANNQHEYIGWIGDDDLLTKGSLAVAISYLDKQPDAVLAFGYCDYVDNNGRVLFTSKAGNLAPWIMTWGPNLVPLPGIVFRKSAFSKAGLFDVDLKYAMDLDMLLRLRKIGSFINTKTRLAAFRWHPDSTTVSNRKLSLKEAKMVKRKHLPAYLRRIAPLWELPVDVATKIAAKRVNKLAQQ